MHDGPYALATISDDGSSVYVDGQIVVDNGGRRVWPRGATGLVTLTRGVHSIYVRYAQEGGPFHFELLWARAGEPLERMPAWALTPRRVSVLGLRAQRGAAPVAGRRRMAVGRHDRDLGADRSPGRGAELEGVARARAGLAGAAVDPRRVAGAERRRHLVGAAGRQLGAGRAVAGRW